MSNIPKARALLKEVIAAYGHVDDRIHQALALMNRKQPKFKAKRSKHPVLAEYEKQIADDLRRGGMALSDISAALGGVNVARLSEYLNG